ncbi:uncharacterized protein LOC130496603 [Raphanus sativus]|uniref:Uncharacterized protein LOC130496603 n=1 Tax=Raphanus sativus TaxID=3726 RepID=A0A9W3BZY0_RAPSA|nr:uncharacterized protein LOC130496603 [Raphanus sativus]
MVIGFSWRQQQNCDDSLYQSCSADINAEETLNTLKYANSARNIRNKPIVNRDPVSTEMLKMRQQLEYLQAELSLRNGGGREAITSGLFTSNGNGKSHGGGSLSGSGTVTKHLSGLNLDIRLCLRRSCDLVSSEKCFFLLCSSSSTCEWVQVINLF